jgi:AmmeMemoRadiSam system protein A
MIHTPARAEAAPAAYGDSRRTRLSLTARQAIESYLQDMVTLQQAIALSVQKGLAGASEPQQAELLAPGAAFVTLWRRDNAELRGCRGECAAHQPLIAAVAAMALAAATDDPRFAAVTPAELSLLRIEISVLTPLIQVQPEEVRIGPDGVMVMRGHARGLLLPQVAVEHSMTREQFLDAVCWKAGLPENAWHSPDTSLWTFQTQCWEEE